MKLFKRKAYLKALSLDKSALEKIEREITNIWIEREAGLLKELKEKFAEHNKEVKDKKYSYVLFTDSEKSKHIFSEREISNYLEKEKDKYIESKTHYPISEPRITYKDNRNEYEVGTIKELFELNIQERFNMLQIEVSGDDNKAITIAFSSNYDVAPLYDNIITISSRDESWTLGTLEKITEILKKYQKPFPFLYELGTLMSASLLLSVLSVYAFHKILNILQFRADLFSKWLIIIAYSAVFFILAVNIGRKWSDLFPKMTIPDVASYKKKKVDALWVMFIAGVLINAAYDLLKFLLSSL